MKILEFMDMNSTKYGGLERFMFRLMKTRSKDNFFFVFQNSPQSEELVRDFTACGAEIIVLDTEGKKAIKKLFQVFKLFLKIKPDLVHFHFANGFFLFAPLAKLAGVKYLVKTQHCCLTTNDLKQIQNKSQFSLKTKILSINGKIYRLFDRIVFCGKYVQQQFESVYGKSSKNKMIYLGVEPINILTVDKQVVLKKQLNISDDCKVITTVLFADPIKGADVLIKAISFIKRDDFIVCIVGVNDNLEFAKNLHRLARNLNVEDKIRWIGITDYVNKYLSISDIYCQPSRSEALGLAVCEAKSAKLPIIGSDICGLPEVSNILFQSENSEELGEKLACLLEDKQLRQELSQQSYQDFCDNFDISIGVEKYSQLYDELFLSK